MMMTIAVVADVDSDNKHVGSQRKAPPLFQVMVPVSGVDVDPGLWPLASLVR